LLGIYADATINNVNSQQLKKILLPDAPGCYYFRKGTEILYIGKATSLRSRVGSYFASDLIKTRGAHIVDMVFRAETVTWQETDSVLEALILEAALIKKHQPYYNTKEKDDKSFLCVGITDEAYPLVLTIRKKDIDFKNKTFKSKYLKTENGKLKTIFGPFTSGTSLKEALRIIRRIFPYQDLSSAKRDNNEFYRQLGLAPGIGDGRQQTIDNRKEYANNIRHIELFFQGKKKQILRELEREMKAYAKSMQFERANDIKKKIFALTHINDIALLKRDEEDVLQGVKPFRIEAYDIAHMSGKSMVGVMTVVRGSTAWKDGYRMFKIKTVDGSNDPAALREVLTRRLNHPEWGMPDLIVVDGNKVQIQVAEEVLRSVKLDIPIVSVVKDDRHKARAILGDPKIVEGKKNAILLANAEAHRFAIDYHKKTRAKAFLK
jgi:excinuclease UvrABC nuclease subunit